VNAPERVDHIRLAFSPPDVGWVDFRMEAGRQSAEFSLSNVRDPFYCGSAPIFAEWNWRQRVVTGDYVCDFIAWLERIAVTGAGTIRVDIERGDVVMAAGAATSPDQVDVTITGPEDEFSMSFRMTRHALVAGFYRQLVDFWEGPVMAEGWWNWLNEDADLHDDGPEEIQRPWPIRSEIVERYLAGQKETGP
jgi:hypothetical protein